MRNQSACCPLLVASHAETPQQIRQTYAAKAAAVQKQEILAFLPHNAGYASKLGNAGEPPRINKTARFVRKHDEIPARLWRVPRVKSAANCEACHTHAADGRFSKHDIAIPELRE